jgi:hypothetical protein
MRDFLAHVFLPVVGAFVGTFLCIGVLIFAAAIAADLVSSPIELAQEDAQ